MSKLFLTHPPTPTPQTTHLSSHEGISCFPLTPLTSPCGRLTLTPLTLADIPTLYSISHPHEHANNKQDPNVHPYYGGFTYGPFATLDDYTHFIQDRFFAKPDVVGFVIHTTYEPDGVTLTPSPTRTCASESDAGGRVIGLIALLSTVPAHLRTELGHVWYDTRYRGTFVGKAAPATVLHWAFEELGFWRVEWKCMPSNVASRRAAVKLGFVYEGTFRKFMVGRAPDRRAVDMDYLAMTDD
ncbi:acyl-CoA N-acyltransferase, partial [Catenaria anguillulae PL171]